MFLGRAFLAPVVAVVLLAMAALLGLSPPISAQSNSEGTADLPADTSSTATTTADDSIDGTATHFSGSISTSDDVDWIKVALTADQMYRFALKGGSTADGMLRTPIVALYDSSGNAISGAWDLLSGSGRNARLHYFVETAGNYWVAASGWSDETGTYRLRVVKVEDDKQPDNTSTPGRITVGSSVTSKIDYRGDTDWFKTSAELSASNTYGVVVSSTRSGLFPRARFFDSDGDLISVFHDAGNALSYTFNPSSDGVYFISVHHWNDRTGPIGMELSQGGL